MIAVLLSRPGFPVLCNNPKTIVFESTDMVLVLPGDDDDTYYRIPRKDLMLFGCEAESEAIKYFNTLTNKEH